jgi:hypothetical protein
MAPGFEREHLGEGAAMASIVGASFSLMIICGALALEWPFPDIGARVE